MKMVIRIHSFENERFSLISDSNIPDLDQNWFRLGDKGAFQGVSGLYFPRVNKRTKSTTPNEKYKESNNEFIFASIEDNYATNSLYSFHDNYILNFTLQNHLFFPLRPFLREPFCFLTYKPKFGSCNTIRINIIFPFSLLYDSFLFD